ncbi:LysR substrate-binding domain-containing protein [Pedobacter steynii]|uniref:LysR family transcriptional regulator n=1 Tax=Pedobacter steynii TaxID=430522 RepID=A0A1D7QJ23_9SPHI|nr:LysR substrate-binding domain-containing protein [Pedobacter steynii]AOM78668.1 LysR family transcriptional regulator [Pedobacter steynii]
MEFRQLNYFIKAAELLHFTDAAAACFVTQSTLSQQIKQLEEELGMPLFDRIGKHVQLSEAGKLFLKHARQILQEVKKSKQAIFELNNLVNGELRVGVTYAFSSLLLPSLTPFSKKYPGIKLHIESGIAGELELRLKNADLDFILAFHEQSDNDGLDMQLLFTSRIKMVTSRSHPLAQLSKISLKDLGPQEMVLANKGFSSRDMLDQIFKKNNIIPNIKIEMNDTHSLLSLVDTGNWITIINEKAITGWDNLIAIPIIGKELHKEAFILWQKGAFKKKSATLFIEELLKTM